MGSVLGSMLSYKNDYDDFADDSDFFENEEFVPKNSPSRPQQEEEEDGYNHLEKGKNVFDSVNSICFDSATDTVNESSSAITQITVSLNEVRTIEEQLDTYEKVAILYLLEDDPEVALQQLSKLINGQSPKLLLTWAKAQNGWRQKCHEKFVEAITIIQNYEVLGKLGFKRKELDVRFLPRHSFTSENVNRFRKALFYVCENLIPTDVDKLLKPVADDFAREGLAMKRFDSSYLEMYFLHWEMIGYLKHDDLNNLYSILKQLQFFDLCDHLKFAVPELQEQKNDFLVAGETAETESDARFVRRDLSLGTDNIAHTSVDTDDLLYQIDPNNPGACLIINQENFYTEVDPQYKHLLPPNDRKLDERLGTERDQEELESTFKMFGFKTEVVKNLKHTAILDQIVKFMERITTESSLFICILSHGLEGIVYGVNSCEVTVKSIQNLMCTKNRINLSGKPKILILQSCQGTKFQRLVSTEQESLTTDGPTSSKQETIPPSADLFTFWSTVPGYSSIRDILNGTWFIQSFCEKLKTLSNIYHFEEICVAVTNDVTKKKFAGIAMVPDKHSTLRNRFFLPPIKG